MQLNLQRPIVFFDLETTGTNVTEDRIVEISIVKLNPDGTSVEKTRRINPGIPIPAKSTAIHHITDEMVACEPTFRQIAGSLLKFFEGCDIGGFNSNKFDIPLLIEEFQRAGIKFEIAGRHLVDVQNIFHKMEQRTLVAAYKFYCGKNLEEAHSANADTKATVEVLQAQLDRYPELKNDIEFLADFSGVSNAVDLQGMIRYDENRVPVFNFGKHRGKPVKEVLMRDRSYYQWIMTRDFAKNTKDVITALYNQALSEQNK